MLGHSKIGTTQIYAEVIDEVKQKAADLMPSL
jgi:site-specific recombinase XerD